MANPLRGEVSIEAGGRTLTLRLSTNAIVEAETLLDLSVNEIAASLSEPKRFRLGMARALMWAGLHGAHPEITLFDAGELIGEIGIPAALDALSSSMRTAFPTQDGKPRPPTPGPDGTGSGSSSTG